MKRIYLDCAATTPVDPQVKEAMLPFLSEKFGNTMSLHSFGREAKGVLDQSRHEVGDLIGAVPEEVFFTSSATESNNTVFKGLDLVGKNIIISPIEHSSIVEIGKYLKNKGVEVLTFKVDKFGKADPLEIENLITKKTALVSVIHASNEVGTIQDIKEIGRVCRQKNILFHTDASQSFGKIPLNVKEMNIDFLTASSHKIYGPKGSALLYIRNGLKLKPLLHGGGQESGLRSSTVNTPAIVGFARACQIAKEKMQEDNCRLTVLRDRLIENVLKIEKSYLTGHPKDRLPNIASFYFDFIEGESIILQLDLAGIAVSTGSACSSIALEPSHVLLALGLKREQAHGSLRVSLGRYTTEEEIDYFAEELKKTVKKLREISPIKKICIQKKL